ncbi:hypothetical protein D3C71_1523540 [compost metagenome]
MHHPGNAACAWDDQWPERCVVGHVQMQCVWLEALNGLPQCPWEAQCNGCENKRHLHWNANQPLGIIRQRIAVHHCPRIDTAGPLLLDQVCQERLHSSAIRRVVLAYMQNPERRLSVLFRSFAVVPSQPSVQHAIGQPLPSSGQADSCRPDWRDPFRWHAA